MKNAIEILKDRIEDVDGVSLEGAAICLNALQHLDPSEWSKPTKHTETDPYWIAWGEKFRTELKAGKL